MRIYRENILTKGILIEVCVLGDKHFFRGCVNDVKMMFESYRYIYYAVLRIFTRICENDFFIER